MKILYIGHYKENSGWSKAAIDYILALDSIGLDVVCRNVKLTSVEGIVPKRILELETKPLTNIEYCIQHVLPHHLVQTQKFKKNVAFFAGETDSIKHLKWFENLKNMDEVWVPNSSYKSTLESDGISKVRCVPHTFDLNVYKKPHKTIDFGKYNNHFKFYSILELNDRKNIGSLLRCYYSEFTRDDNVILMLKLKKPGVKQEDLYKFVQSYCDNIKSQLRIFKDKNKYPQELIIVNEFSEEEILALHNTCDCFVEFSHGEGWCIPAFEAMCFGKTPICSKEGGPLDYIGDDTNNGILIDGQYGPCVHSNPAFPDIFTARENWFFVDEKLAKKSMRVAMSRRGEVDRNAGINNAIKYDYEHIANIIKEILNDK
jgi:glycosyltransferase involved in cell wall biosynthesis